MYLLAADYDGTLKKDSKSLYLNIEAIDRFRKQGNKFAIVTGRSFLSIKNEINSYSIKYDYVSCNNGLIVFDNNDKILNKTLLDNEIAKIILSELEQEDTILNINKYGIYDKVYNLDDLLEFSVKFKTKKHALLFKKYIENKRKEIRCINFGTRLFISSNVTKSNAVNFIHNLEKIDKNKVYTIGDDINDLEMIRDFNGYKMFNSNPKIWLMNRPFTKEVHTLVKKLSK